MRLMLYVRFYTNWHIRKSGATFTFPIKAVFFLLQQHFAAVRFLSIDAVEKLMTEFLVGARGVV